MFAINAYTGNWVLVETVALCKTREQAETLLANANYLVEHRRGLTIVIEKVNLR